MSKVEHPDLVFLHDQSKHSLQTRVTSIEPFVSLSETDKPLFKAGTNDDQVITTEKTVFYPQGGGQPSDVGKIVSAGIEQVTFDVSLVRSSITKPTRVLHLGRFANGATFEQNQEIAQTIDSEKRNLYCRYHTAGHVIGLAVNQLLPEVEDAKASHHPDMAFVEFKGLIDGKHKDAIQARVDQLVQKAIPVKIHWWDVDTMKANCVGGLDGIEEMLGEGVSKLRAVEIEGVGSYPCGGTHLPLTSDIGTVQVTRIKRQKGISKVSYTVS